MKIMSIVCILNYQSFKPRLFIKKLFSEVGTFSAEKKKEVTLHGLAQILLFEI